MVVVVILSSFAVIIWWLYYGALEKELPEQYLHSGKSRALTVNMQWNQVQDDQSRSAIMKR